MSSRLALYVLTSLVASSAGIAAQQRFAELRRSHLPEPRGEVTALASIDFDGNAAPDLLVGRYGAPSEIWVNDGRGTFRDAGVQGNLAFPQNTTAMAVGDVDGDGVDDILQATSGSGLVLLLGNFGGWWQAPQSHLPAISPYQACVALFDVDGDGDVDAVHGEGSASGQLHVLRNDGTGRFIAGPQLIAGVYATDLVPFDRDGDGDLDLLVLTPNSPPMVFDNNAGTMQVVAFPFVLGPATAGAVGDVDGDGDMDVVLGSRASNPLNRQPRFLRNDGAGNFSDDTAVVMPVLDLHTNRVHLSDLDGDGDLDAMFACSQPQFAGSRLAQVHLVNGGGVFTDASQRLPQNDRTGRASLLLDVDGDGDDDYVFADADTEHLYWNDRGVWLDAGGPAVPYRSSTTASVAVGDLDGDGMPDAISAGWNFSILGGRNSMLWNDGTGRLREAPTNPTFPNGLYSAAAFGDLDGDGDLDLVLGQEQAQPRVYRNDGSRVLTDVTASALPQLYEFVRAVRLFDVDADGDVDIWLVNQGPSRVLQNDGTGVFTDASAVVLPGGGGGSDLAVGDIDGDGDPDAVRANPGGANQVLRNQGGVFTVDASALPGTVQATEAVALADVDGDGDLDLLVGNGPAPTLDPRSWLYRNDGTGTFLTPPLALDALDVRTIATGDIEGDGDVDFVLGGHDRAPRLFENLGGGFFTTPVDALPDGARRSAELVLVDIDGDGDLDLFEGDQRGDRLLHGLHRQLWGRQLLVPGGSADFELFALGAAPGGAPFAALALGTPTAPQATPFGALRLDAATLVPVAVLALPPQAPSASWTLSVPGNPALIGLEVAGQALIAHDANPSSWRLTGQLRETVRR